MIRGARFDDVRAGRAHRFDAPDEVLVATTPDEVAGVLAALDAATTAGAWAYGYLAYEAASGLDPHLVTRAPDPDGPPLAWFGLTRTPPVEVPVVGPAGAPAGRWTPRDTALDHAARVARVHEHIAAGLTYQTNLTARVDGVLDLAADPDLVGLYADLAHAQRGSHHALLDLGRFVVVSASPELFVRRDGDELTVRPMKGTAARGRTTAEDEVIAARLRADPKERAENVMIVDLLRNDVSRVAVDGSVRVGSLCAPERYETVWQLTSEVTATARPGTGVLDLMRALFPCGSVTGAPKGSTMRLIADVEDAPRGVYCGAIGWVAPSGHGTGLPDVGFSVAIRTAVVDRSPPGAAPGRPARCTAPGAGSPGTPTPPPSTPRPSRRPASSPTAHPPPACSRPSPYVAGSRSTSTATSRGSRTPRRSSAWTPPRSGPPSRRTSPACARPACGWCCTATAPWRSPSRRSPATTDPSCSPRHCSPTRSTPRRTGRTTRPPTASPTPAASPRPAAPGPTRTTSCWSTRQASSPRRRSRRSRCASTTAGAPRPWAAVHCPASGRAVLVERGDLVERVLHPDDLERASGLAVVSSLRGWRPAVLAGALTPRAARP